MGALLVSLSKNNRWAIVLALLLLIAGVIIINLQNNSINEWKDKHETEVKFKDALSDTMIHYQNKYSEVVSEKLTLQTSIVNLKETIGLLNDNQAELLDRIEKLNSKNNIIAAALIETKITIDSLMGATVSGSVIIDTTNNTINFNNTSTVDSNFVYDINVYNVFPLKDNKPTIFFKKIYFPNKQFIEFHWKDNKEKGYPISFSVSNSNKYFNTVNIESYVIPTIKKTELNPTGWDKFNDFFLRNTKTLQYFGIGAASGGVLMYLLIK